MRTSPLAGNRGVLFPQRLVPSFRRVAARPEDAHLVSWWWLARWDFPEGAGSDQHLVAFPSCNLAVEDSMVGLAGPTTRASRRRLEGRGWVVGALLRPAAVAALTEPARIRDQYVVLDEPALHAAVVEVVGDAGADGADRAGGADLAGGAADGAGTAGGTGGTGATVPTGGTGGTGSLEDAVPIVGSWLRRAVEAWSGGVDVPEEALLANRMAELAGAGTVKSVPELAAALAVSERTLHRLSTRYVGLTPYALLRRRRIQEAAEAVREQSEASLADLAADLGFTDHAHLAREFRQVLGYSPSEYRERSATERT